LLESAGCEFAASTTTTRRTTFEDERSDATRAFVCVEFVDARSSRYPRVGVGVCGRNAAGGEF
jgi:hypothetical protein